MPGVSPDMIPLADWIAEYMIVVARLSFVIFLMPGIGEQVIPVQVRALLLVALSAAVTAAGIIPSSGFSTIPGFALILGTEAVIGLMLGVGLRLAIWMLNIVGSILAQAIGLSQLLGIALDNESQAITSNMLAMAGAAILLSANYHIEAIAAFVGLYSDIPAGGPFGLDQAFLFDSFYAAFGFALLLAWPFVLVNLLYNISMGFINKALPSLMVAFVGAPFMVGAGLFLLFVSIVGLMVVWKDRAFQVFGWM